MSMRRGGIRLSAWIAFSAVLLSMLPPMLAHGHGAPPGFDGHVDFCSTVGTTNAAPSVPRPAGGEQEICPHCDGCTGNAAGAWAPPTPAAPAFTLRAAPSVLIDMAVLPPTSVDWIAARPRGPPRPA
jgi:hypothetical protein